MHLKGDFLSRVQEIEPRVELQHDLTDLKKSNLTQDAEPKLLLLDDVANEFFKSQEMLELVGKKIM